jgi:hypothetical protein
MSDSNGKSCARASPTAMRARERACSDERTAAAEISSYTIAFASASWRQKSSSSAVERQLSGVAMIPANWHAQ